MGQNPHRIALCFILWGTAIAGCPAEEPPPLVPTKVGTVVGRVYIEDEGELVSVDGAVIELYGTSHKLRSAADKQFVLQNVPIGTHSLLITHPGIARSTRFSFSLEAAYQTLVLDRAQTTLKKAAILTGVVDGGGAGTSVYLIGGNHAQVTTTGADGSFELRNLPAAKVSIGFSKVGYDTSTTSITLDEGDNALDSSVALSTSSKGDLTLKGKVALDGQVDHRGVAVLLNGGEQVASTDEEGNYKFTDLSPGLFTLRAQIPGYKSAELASVALTADGKAHGLVDVFLTPGEDSEEDEAERHFEVRIAAPASGVFYEEGDDIQFVADVQIDDEVIPQGSYLWSVMATDSDDDVGEPLCNNDGAGNCVGDSVSVDSLGVGSWWVNLAVTAFDGETKTTRIAVNVVERDKNFETQISSPIQGSSFPQGTEINFLAEVSIDNEVIPDSSVRWTYTIVGDDDSTPIPLCDNDGAGHCVGRDILVSTLPIGSFDIIVTATSSADDIRSDQVRVSTFPRDKNFAVDISSPEVGARFEQGEEIVFLLDIQIDDEIIPPGQVSWTVAPADDSENNMPLCDDDNCPGNPIAYANLNVGDYIATAIATASDGEQRQGQVLFHVDPVEVDINIETPLSGAEIQVGSPTVFSATVDVRDDVIVVPDDIVWSFGSCDSPGEAMQSTGEEVIGAISQAYIPSTAISVRVTLPEDLGSACDDVLVLVQPKVSAAAKPGFGVLGVDAPDVDVVDDDGTPVTQYRISEGQPVELRADASEEETIAWSTDSGFSNGGQVFDLSLLPAGEHAVTLTVEDLTGNVGTTNLHVQVDPLEFALTVGAPKLSQSYTQGNGVAFSLAIQHSFQSQLFHIEWVDALGRVISTQPSGQAFGLPVGPGTLRVFVTDAVGNQRIAENAYYLAPVDVDVEFTSPLHGSTFSAAEAAEGISVSLDVSHSLVDSGDLQLSDLHVSLLSQQGLLNDDTGPIEDRPLADSFTIVDLEAGTHQIFALVSDGARTATTQIEVSVSATATLSTVLLSPLAEPYHVVAGDDLQLQAAVIGAGDENVRMRWFLDDVEFDSSWASYGDETFDYDTSRLAVTLPAYDSTTPPYDDERWAPNTIHTVSFCATADSGAEECVHRTVIVPEETITVSATNLGPDDEPLIIDTDLYVTGDLSVQGGTLIIRPGVRVVFADGAWLRLESGVLHIGEEDGERVVLEGKSGTAGVWDGVILRGAWDGQSESEAVLHHVDIRHAYYGVSFEGYWSQNDEAGLHDVLIERSYYGIANGCADDMDNIVIRDMTYDGIHEGYGYRCVDRVYEELTIEDVGGSAFYLHDSGSTVTLRNNVVTDAYTGVSFSSSNAESYLIATANQFTALRYNGFDLHNVRGELEQNVLDNASTTDANAFYLSYTYSMPLDSSATPLRVIGNDIVGWDRGVYLSGTRTVGPAVHMNNFVGNETHIYSTSTRTERLEANFLGSVDQPFDPGAKLLDADAGSFPTSLPRVEDAVTQSTGGLVDLSHTLAQPVIDGATPLAVITSPSQWIPYGPCVPAARVAEGAFGEVAFDIVEETAEPAISCYWQFDGADAEISDDDDGCLLVDGSASFAAGEHSLGLICDLIDFGDDLDSDEDNVVQRSSEHMAKFLVEDEQPLVGRIVEDMTWSGLTELRGDVVIPQGITVTIEAGTEVVVPNADGLYSYVRSSNGSGAQHATSRGHVDIVVEGELLVEGSADAPVIFRHGTSLAGAVAWGGIIGLPGSKIDLEHADIRSAKYAISGLVDDGLGPLPAEISLVHVTVTGGERMVSGTCPVTFDNVVAQQVDHVLYSTVCSADLTITNSSFSDIARDVIYNPSRSSFAPSIAFVAENVEIIRSADRSYSAFRLGSDVFTDVTIRDVYATHLNIFVENGGAYNIGGTLLIEDVYVENTNIGIHGHGSDYYNFQSATVRNSVFDGLSRFVEYETADYSIFENVRVAASETVFYQHYLGTATKSLTVTDSDFSGMETFLSASHYSADFGVVVNNNNIHQPTTYIFDFYYDPNPTVGGELDFTGNYYGLDDATDIAALIGDARNDNDDSDEVVGLTDFSDWSSTELALPDLPPLNE